MTTKKLDASDFAAMDVHRPLTDEEIKEINPQALMDKSADPRNDEDSAEEGVDTPQPRCWACFGPMPCEQHANVEPLAIVTSHDLPPASMLAKAHNADLETVVIVGYTKEGSEFFASSCADAAEGMYHLQRGIYKLNKIVDGTDEAD